MAKTPQDGCVYVVIEIPRGSRNKYEIDHEDNRVYLDRRLFTATTYPADYGFIPDTLGGDGDALDALVLLDDPVYPGVWVEARPIAVLYMEDEKGEDAKLICVPPGEPRWSGTHDVDDLTPQLMAEIQHFFEVYKALEPDKHSSTAGVGGAADAWREIEQARANFHPPRPMIVRDLHHVSINVTDVDRAVRFYAEVLGLEQLPRPDFGFGGAWLGVGSGRQVHLIQADVPPDRGQHFAFQVDDIDATVDALRTNGVEVRGPVAVADTAARQAFFADPDGNRLELNQPA